MIHSMTAYSRKDLDTEIGRLSCEIRSVNHRYLDMGLRLPEDLRVLESKIREAVSGQLKRGKVEITIRLHPSTDQSRSIQLSTGTLEQLKGAADTLGEKFSTLQSPSWIELLRWPGIIEDTKYDEDQLAQIVLSLVNQVITDLCAARQREGAKLQEIIASRLSTMEQIVDDIHGKMPQILEQQRQKLLARLEEIKGELDQTRLEQEMLYLAQRMDVDEELQRLRVHINEIRQSFTRKEPVGRRLDFLMQELNREANTLGSKSVHSDSTKASVDMKVLIEQMREQIQNIE